MPIKTFGQLTLKMYHTMDQLNSKTIDVLELFERWTLDAIGIAGFGKSKYESFMYKAVILIFFIKVLTLMLLAIEIMNGCTIMIL